MWRTKWIFDDDGTVAQWLVGSISAKVMAQTALMKEWGGWITNYGNNVQGAKIGSK